MITQNTGVKILNGYSVRLEAVTSDLKMIDNLITSLRIAMKSQNTGSNVASRRDGSSHLTLDVGKLPNGELALVMSALNQTPLVLSEPDPPQSQPNSSLTDK